MNIILFGPPAAGKGTQARRLSAERNMAHLATGDMLRAARSAGTPLGAKVADIMDRGELVSDEIVISLIEENLSQSDAAGGAIFDGFPRTVPQAEALEAVLNRRGESLDVVVHLKVDEDQLVGRVEKRLAEEGRTDDELDTFLHRLKGYGEYAGLLLPYYENQGKVRTVDGMRSPDEVFTAICAALDAVPA